jgi:hypothetical protein
MSTAMITACFTGLVRAVGMLLAVIVPAETIYLILFSEVSEEATGNNVCNPYHFENATKSTAKALGFIFFIQPRKYQLSFLRREDAARENVYATSAFQNLTCL